MSKGLINHTIRGLNAHHSPDCFHVINETGLSEKCKQKVEKAYRVVPDMVATIAFYFIMIDVFMDNMGSIII